MEVVDVDKYANKSAIAELKTHYSASFLDTPLEVIVRVPGRVNLIGEHIDYCGYAVHPMAIDQDVLVALGRNKDGILRLVNVENSKYPDFATDLAKIEIDSAGRPDWWKYFLCGIKGVAERFQCDAIRGMNCLVNGKIPPSAGLSSSSAVVVASAICTLWANDLKMTRTELADLCAQSERFIGTQGGGMDQAIEILAKSGSAMLIEFNPLRTFDVNLPDGAVFVIANSLSEANKAAGSEYNTRVAECRIATKILGKTLGYESWVKVKKLGDLQKALNINLNEMCEHVNKILHQEPYSKQEICSILGWTEEMLTLECLNKNTENLDRFNLHDRALHVFSEAQRVYDFKKACDDSSPDSLEKLGSLMFDSHSSCSDLYQCSHPNLDKLVSISKTNGALGARLTGAGWGGCIVALVPSDQIGSYITALKENYYQQKTDLKIDDYSKVVFPTTPGEGATIFGL